MNTEIKYRGKRTGTDEWVYGNGIVIIGNDYAAIPNTKDVTDESFAITLIKVIPGSIGRAVGLIDRTGKEIYEGDIVRCWDNAAEDPHWKLDKIHTGIITTTPPCYSLKIPGKLTYDGGSVKHWDNDVYLNEWCNAENIEIIGNAYESPELLS